MRSSFSDRTDLAEAEPALALMIDLLRSSTQHSLIGMDLQGRIVLWNEGARRQYGYEPGEVVDKAGANLIHAPEDVVSGRAREIREAALREGKWEGCLEHVHKNGRRFTARSVFLPYRDREGRPTGLLLIGEVPPGEPAAGQEGEGKGREAAEPMAGPHAWLFEQVRKGRERLQVLSRQLLAAQEAERRRLARELHDQIGQALTAVKINLQALRRSFPESADRLDESITLVERTLQDVRDLSLDLRPSLLDDLGLVPALEWYLDRQAQRAGLDVRLDAEPLAGPVPPEVETACFRIVQEAVTNVLRHARARHVWVELRPSGEELRLAVRDDGIGFDVAAAEERAARGASLGLLGMQERALLVGGQLQIRSTPSGGTEILARLPLASVPLERRGGRRNLP
ncbi:MAG TPA: ATP-binding protein [Gemmataceae bacterium]|nr:ATP-binding protein [Gemmataceae bacterium]